jgi:hypothetical protein
MKTIFINNIRRHAQFVKGKMELVPFSAANIFYKFFVLQAFTGLGIRTYAANIRVV